MFFCLTVSLKGHGGEMNIVLNVNKLNKYFVYIHAVIVLTFSADLLKRKKKIEKITLAFFAQKAEFCF